MTGWTLGRELLWEDSETIKLFSLHKYLQLLYLIIFLQVINYSWLFKPYVKMFIAGRLYARVNRRNLSTPQRLNKKHFVKNKDWFEQWLVGLSDGEGSFGFYYQNGKWVLVFKIALSRYNLRALYYIKTNLGIGTITKDGTKAQILIRDRTKLANIIFPIFDKYPLLTSKYFNYLKLKKAFNILNDNSLSKLEKDKLLFSLKKETVPINYTSPAWNSLVLPLNYYQVINIISKPWLSGFVEGEGSFYLVNKDKNRIVHGFGIYQKLDYIVLEGIKIILHISTTVRFKEKHNYYILDTTNSRALENIVVYFKNSLIGMKSPEYKIWANSYLKDKGDYNKLSLIRERLRNIKNKLLGKIKNRRFFISLEPPAPPPEPYPQPWSTPRSAPLPGRRVRGSGGD